MGVETDSLGRYDIAVVGGGVMGCSTALPLAETGLKVAVFDRRGLGLEASGRNAGSLSPMIKKAELVAHAMEGYRMWMSSKDWLGIDIGAHSQPGLIIAYNEAEAHALKRLVANRCENGGQIKLISGNQAYKIEPSLSSGVALAAFSKMDGHGESNRTGQVFNVALKRAGAEIFSHCEVRHVVNKMSHFEIYTDRGIAYSKEIILAGGAWLEKMASWLGFRLPVQYKVNQMIVTERSSSLIRTVIGVQNGLLTLKQASNGTIVIGGGWQGHGDLEKGAWHIEPEAVIRNLQIARYVIPQIKDLRVVRAWLGLEAILPDYLPAVGAVPGVTGAYIIGCCRGGWAIGPCLGSLLANFILGRPLKLPIFDPGRKIDSPPFVAAGSGLKGM